MKLTTKNFYTLTLLAAALVSCKPDTTQQYDCWVDIDPPSGEKRVAIGIYNADPMDPQTVHQITKAVDVCLNASYGDNLGDQVGIGFYPEGDLVGTVKVRLDINDNQQGMIKFATDLDFVDEDWGNLVIEARDSATGK